MCHRENNNASGDFAIDEGEWKALEQNPSGICRGR